MVAERLAAVDDIDYVVMCTGSFDILVELVCEDEDALLELLNGVIRQHPRRAGHRDVHVPEADQTDLHLGDAMTDRSDEALQESAHRHLWMHFTRMSPSQRRSRSSSGARASGSTTSTASATSTACPACSPARSATVAPSWPRRRPARPAPWPTSRCGATPTRPPSSWPTAWPSLTPGDCNRIFFTTGGSEAVESAWKLARQYFRRHRPARPRYKVISRNIAYHGATMGALSITGLADIRTPFEPLVPGAVKVPNTNFYRAPYFADDLEAFGRWAADAIEQAILIEGPSTVAAVFLEPVQNAGGCFPPPPGYFQRVREICDRYGVLLVSDEVICAFGRLGHWFGAERYDYRPDIVTMAKGLTSGYSPLGAMAVSDRLVEPFLHGRDLPPRDHLRRPPGERGGGPGQHRRVREGRAPRARAGQRGRLPGVARHARATCPSSATSGGPATSTGSSWSRTRTPARPSTTTSPSGCCGASCPAPSTRPG